VNVADFDFDLPAAQIAQDPAPRGESRLLVLHRASDRVEHARVAQIGPYLRPGDLLVVNDTRVFPARLLGRREPSGGAVECLLMGAGRPVEAEPGAEEWDALVHPGQKLKPGARMVFESPAPQQGPTLYGEILARRFQGRRTIRLWESSGGHVAAAVDAIGHMPLPPYIDRPDRPEDRERYQTVYAKTRGSIAAPTAGLHFTDALLAELEARGVERVAVTLHVGYGTFKPVRVDRVEDHTVDPEVFEVSAAAASAISKARREGRRVIAVGTTTARVLESLVPGPSGDVEPVRGETGTFIYPGHVFRLLDGLVTNFHLPRSSLLMLVCAFGGRDHVLAAYREAVASGYRFYSYGDAMLVV
jgi:S-adenosylmethionine:tRNA ribosyltransferase-isomerase